MKKIKITIEDSGVGIQKKDLDKLFKHFGKLKDDTKLNEKGCGLGLMISKRIVESMGGEISVESTYGQGSKFTMCIMVQVSQNPIMEETESEIENSISMEKIKTNMITLGNNMISGGLLGNCSMDFDRNDSVQRIFENEDAFMDNKLQKLIKLKKKKSSSNKSNKSFFLFESS
jgi:ribosomal protein S4E